MRSDRRRRARGPERAASAAELAGLLERLCAHGIELRAGGSCLGELPDGAMAAASARAGETGEGDARRAREAGRADEGLRVPRSRRAAAERSARVHRARGHDDGCRAFGVPLDHAARFVRERDPMAAAPLLMETLRDAAVAIEEASVHGMEGWSPEMAREVVAWAIRRRITPRTGAHARVPP